MPNVRPPAQSIRIGLLGFLMVVGCSTGEPTDPVVESVTNTVAESVANPVESAGQEPAPAIDTDSAYPSPANWKNASDRQAIRAQRSIDQLKLRQVPCYDGPLFVADDEQVQLQTPQAVARRALVLWAVELRAEGVPREDAVAIIEQNDLWDSVSPNEKRFLNASNPDPTEARELVWRLESLWVLMWALGYIDELTWPEDMCDVPTLVAMIRPQEANPDFINQAKLRSKAEIIDAQDLIMRVHWAVRDAYLNERRFPSDLDWSGDSEMVDISTSAALGVVEQRHYVLNWLVNYPEPAEWDDVDTPT